MPLAIELAAARSRVLDPRALLARLEATGDGTFLQLLAQSARDVPVRQQTLPATLTWSYDPLDPAAQRLFRRLAVFADGGDLQAIEAVCGDLGVAVRERGSRLGALDPGSQQSQPRSDVQILDGLATLLDHSLLMIQSDTGGARRFMMLETIREYARNRLEADGELMVMRQHHATYYLALAETAAPELQGPRQMEWFACLEANRANLCVALEWLAAVDTASGLRLANALCEFWWVRCYLTEGRTWLERMLGQVTEPSLVRASALSGAGLLAYRQGDYAVSQVFHTQGLAIWRMFAAAHQCDYERAVPLYNQSLATARAIDDRHGIALTLSNLGDVLRCRHEYMQAEERYAASLPLFRALGDQHGIAWGLHNLGQIALALNDARKTAALFQESLVLCRDLGAKVGIAYGLAGMAGVAVMRGQLPRAARLLGAVEVLLETIRGRMNAADRVAYARNVDAVCTALNQTSFEAAWQRGRACTAEQSIIEALDDWHRHSGDTNEMVERATSMERPR